MRDAGGDIKVVAGIAPIAKDTGAKNGVVIDTLGFESCVAAFITGVDAGTPDSFSVACKVQHDSDANFGTPVDVTDADGTITTEAGIAQININLVGLNRYIRCVATPTFVGGAGPTIEIAATVSLGQAKNLPAA